MYVSTNTLLRGLLAGTLLLAGSTMRSAAQDLKSPVPTDPGLVKGKFANGLTYYVRPNSKPAKKSRAAPCGKSRFHTGR